VSYFFGWLIDGVNAMEGSGWRMGRIDVVSADPQLRRFASETLQVWARDVRVFRSADELLASPSYDTADCIVADVALPGKSGLALQDTLTCAPHFVPFVFLTRHTDVSTVVQAVKAGAIDFLVWAEPTRRTANGAKTRVDNASHDFDLQAQLITAVSTAMARRHKLLELARERNELLAHFALLTPRERQVLFHVRNGLLNKQIAHQLAISEKTVKFHRGQLMKKVQAHSVAQLVQLADTITDAQIRPIINA